MSKIITPPSVENAIAEADAPVAVNSLSSAALARRHMLLKSLGKGTAVVAAASVPMHSLAAIGTLSVTANGKRCTMSGTMSGVHSKESTTAVCEGYAPTKYQTLANWPGYTVGSPAHAVNTVDGITFNESNTIKSLFSGYGNTTLLVKLTNNPTSDQAVWITALLNSLKSASLNYPYSATEVRALYNAGGTTRSNALDFFRGYMQTVT